MNISTLLTTLKTALVTNSALKTWCVTNYTKAHTIYLGVDLRKPPGSSECPLIVLVIGGKKTGMDLDRQDHVIGVTCELYDTTLTATTTSGVTDNVYRGITNIEAYRKLVETAIIAAIPSGLFLAELAIEFDSIETFPFFAAMMDMKFTAELYQGGDAFA